MLDVGLGFNFKVREHPLYYLIKAKIEKRATRIESSVGLLRTALDLPVFSGILIIYFSIFKLFISSTSNTNLLNNLVTLPLTMQYQNLGHIITKDSNKFDVSESDRIAIYLELIDSLILMDQMVCILCVSQNVYSFLLLSFL